jgi:hypothetical protein
MECESLCVSVYGLGTTALYGLGTTAEREGNLDAGWGGHGVRMGNVCGSLVRKSMHGGNGVAMLQGDGGQGSDSWEARKGGFRRA